MKLSLPPKLVEKLVWVPVNLFCKISFPVTHLMPYYAETGRSRPPNRLTLPITLLARQNPTQLLPCLGLLFSHSPPPVGCWGFTLTQNLQISLQNNGSDIKTCQTQLHLPLYLGVSIGADKGGVMEGG
jgi:hypothetical protein